jgi:hypothetical protein
MDLIRLEFNQGKTKIIAMPPMIASSRFPNKPKLLDQVRDVIRRKHYSIRTEQAYIDWIKRFIIYHDKRHPAEIAEGEVARFLTRLARDRDVAPSTQNQALSGLLFLYKEVLKHEIGWLEKVEQAKKPPKLPRLERKVRWRSLGLCLRQWQGSLAEDVAPSCRSANVSIAKP